VKGKGQSFGIFTGRMDAADDMKTLAWFQPWETAYGGSGGNIEFYGQVRAQGGLAGGVAPLWIKPIAGDPAPGFLKDGDEWVDSVAGAKKIFIGGVIKTFTLV
jgi:hypothetical protein